MKTIAIMQPAYLPWLGYFDMMDQGDAFVLLDSVQFDKRSWQQRNRIKTPGGEQFLTVPVISKGRFSQRINEARIDRTGGFHKKHIRAVEINYAKAKFFKKYMETLANILKKEHVYLTELTVELISWLREAFGIKTELIRSSALDVRGAKVELLVSICKTLGAARYISPQGSADYINENNIFNKNGIELCYHEYIHPQYTQLHGDFIPYLSAIDLVLNEGDQSLSIIRSGRGGSVSHLTCTQKR